MEQTTEEILQARGLRNGAPGPHGEWQDNAVTGQGLKVVIRVALNKRAADGIYPQLSAIHLEALDMIALKMARIATGDANEPDHWQDIEGYAKLCRERLGATLAQVRGRAKPETAQTAGGDGVRTGSGTAGGTSAPADPPARTDGQRLAPVARPAQLTRTGDDGEPVKRDWQDILKGADAGPRIYRTQEQEGRLEELRKLSEMRKLTLMENGEKVALLKLLPASPTEG